MSRGLVVTAIVCVAILLPAMATASHTSGIFFADQALLAPQGDGADDQTAPGDPGTMLRVVDPDEDVAIRVDRTPGETPPVPEPATLWLLAGGLTALMAARKKR